MWSLFHTSAKGLAQSLRQKLEGQCLQVQIENLDLPTRGILDTSLWYLLSNQLVLVEESGTCSLHEGGGTLRWAGSRDDAGLDEHIAGLLHEWPLKEMGTCSGTRTILRSLGPDGPVPAACQDSSAADKANHTALVTIMIDECRINLVSRETCKGALVTILAAPSHHEIARKLVKYLTNEGGLVSQWPLMHLVERAASNSGWNQPETAVMRRAEWSDQLSPLIRLLEQVRDKGDPASVHESRVMLRHIRILLDISRRLSGKEPKSAGLETLLELESEMDTLRHLDVLIRFLETGRTVDAPTWLGIPGILESCPELDGPRRSELLLEFKSWRNDEHLRLTHSKRFLAQPVMLHELSARWPSLPRFTKRNKDQRQQMTEYLDSCIKKLVREIKSLPEHDQANLETWQALRWRCRKIYELLDTWPALKKLDEVRFLRQMVRLWLHRLGELQDIQSSLLLLLRHPDSRLPAGGSGGLRDSTGLLADAMVAWVGMVTAQVNATLPALHLAARNARKHLDLD